MQKGLTGRPRSCSTRTPSRLRAPRSSPTLALSKTARYAAYCKSTGGSDWHDCYVMDVASRKTLPDELKWVKVSDIAWKSDGFFYSRYSEPARGKELTASNDDHKVYYHRVGTPQSADELAFEDTRNPQRFHTVATTEDERFAILDVSERGKGKDGNALYFRDLNASDKTWKPIVSEIGNDSYQVIGNVGDAFLIQTNANAPNWKVVRFDPQASGAGEMARRGAGKARAIETVSTAGGKLFVTYLKDVTTRAYVHASTASSKTRSSCPAWASRAGSAATTTISSSSTPSLRSTSRRRSTGTRSRPGSPRSSARPTSPASRPRDYETKQVFYTSKDGTRVPMFIVTARG